MGLFNNYLGFNLLLAQLRKIAITKVYFKKNFLNLTKTKKTLTKSSMKIKVNSFLNIKLMKISKQTLKLFVFHL